MTKRIYELEVGDEIFLFGIRLLVRGKSEERIFLYREKGKGIIDLGAHSRQIVVFNGKTDMTKLIHKDKYSISYRKTFVLSNIGKMGLRQMSIALGVSKQTVFNIIQKRIRNNGTCK